MSKTLYEMVKGYGATYEEVKTSPVLATLDMFVQDYSYLV